MLDRQDYEDNIKKEFAQSEGISTDNIITNLGSVDTARVTKTTTQDDPEIIRINELAGHQKLDLTQLPSGGKFYRGDFSLSIRAAKVGEIRDYSTIDETDLKDVDDKLNNILISCCKVMYGSQRGSYKDILEEDRIYIILKIRELTFKDGESKIMMPVKSRSCTTSACKGQESIELRTENLQFNSPSDTIEKYYDSENKCYKVLTKNYGEISLAPPTIGVMRSVTEYIKKRESEGKSWDRSSLSIFPYLQREWRNLTNSAIFSSITQFEGWDVTKFTLIYRLVEQIQVGVKPEMIYPCNSCGAETVVPLSFPGGIKSIFIISDISSELL